MRVDAKLSASRERRRDGGVREPREERNDHEADPDYRFTLANERTFLAWIRTALGLLAGAVALVHLVSEDRVTAAQRTIGVILTLLAVLIALTAVRRWQSVQSHMRRGADLPANRDPILLVWYRYQI